MASGGYLLEVVFPSLGQFAETHLAERERQFAEFFRQIVPLNLRKFVGTICRIPSVFGAR